MTINSAAPAQPEEGSLQSASSPKGPVVAVIGGGITGLSAAQRLVAAGAQVIVLEADVALGGKLITSTFAGRPVDHGPDAFLARAPWAVELARSVGLGDSLVAPALGNARVFVNGRLLPFPARHVLGIPASADAEDVAAVLSPAALDRLRADVATPGGPPPKGGDESIGAFFRRRLGDEVVESLIGPLVGGINAGNVDALSLAATTPQLDALARGDEPSLVTAAAAIRERAAAAPPQPLFLAPVGGMATLIDALEQQLVAVGVHIHRGISARSLERLPTGWRVIADPSHGGGGVATDTTFVVDAVIVTAPAPVTATLIQDHAPTAAMHLGSIPHASVALTTLSIHPDSVPGPLDGSGFVVPRSSGLVLTACSWASSKWGALAPEHGDGTLLLRASAGRADDRRISELDDDAIVEQLTADLAVTMGLSAVPVAARVHRWPSSFPQYTVGHLGRVTEIESDLASHAPTLGVAGNALRGVGIPASIQSAQAAADQVLGALARA